MSSETRANPEAAGGHNATNSDNKHKQQVLKTLFEAKTPKLKLNEIDMESQDLPGVGPATAAAAAASHNHNNSNSNKLSEYYSNKKNAARSLSRDGEDEKFIDSILNAKDRRTSWQQVRSQKSFVPSLSAICKCCNYFTRFILIFCYASKRVKQKETIKEAAFKSFRFNKSIQDRVEKNTKMSFWDFLIAFICE
jgi:hypothetical protein